VRRLFAVLLLATPLRAQQPSATPTDKITIDRIFTKNDFRGAPLPSIRWMRDGQSFLDVRPDGQGGSDIVRVDASTGAVKVLAEAAELVDDRGARITVEDVSTSTDESKLLLFHNSVRLWRTNTRGTYHVYDLTTRRLTPVSTRPGLQMFAKFAPDGHAVAFARDHDLWVADLTTGAERRLTTDGTDNIINGTTDWAYEEELALRDAFRWSPDSRQIAFWRFDQSKIPVYPILDDSTLYPRVLPLRYPKAGEPNSTVRIGVVDLGTGSTTWMDTGPDSTVYLPRVDWRGSDSLIIERLPRHQTQLDVMIRGAATGTGRTMFSERDSAYVDVTEPRWLADGKQFLWLSDRSGWRQVYLYDRAGQVVRQVTTDGTDVLAIAGVDDAAGTVYVVAAAPDPTQRQIYRYSLRGGPGQRVTVAPGVHTLSIGPGARWAVDIHSTLADPPTATTYALPAMTKGHVLVDNAPLRAAVAALSIRPPEFIHVPMPDGSVLDGYRIAPLAFDSTKKYPVLMFVYGGPANPTVVDQWGGRNYLWHQMLAQSGYIVVSVDNHGAAWRGRAFRKGTQLHLGVKESEDQVDVAKWLGARSWGDATRIGIWGWSYGGYLTSLTAERGGPLFKAAISVAPVTDWRLYDSIYTERYMSSPADNTAGYDSSSVQRHVGGLSATLLLVHGTGDDNVHPQNSIQYAAALEAAGKPFYMLLYPNRTHAISGGNSQAHLFESLTRFVHQEL
jgi:dipeptidyl-peptidase-4